MKDMVVKIMVIEDPVRGMTVNRLAITKNMITGNNEHCREEVSWQYCKARDHGLVKNVDVDEEMDVGGPDAQDGEAYDEVDYDDGYRDTGYYGDFDRVG
ncbi:hypothetical protein WAI453_004961 [Rhynchosporium graminicola]